MATSGSRRKIRPRPKAQQRADASSQIKALYDHPAGYRVGSVDLATLSELLDPTIPTLSLAELSDEQRTDLVVARLRAKPDDYSIAMIGPGVINKTRAIAEVQARSRVGRTLLEIEQLLIAALVSRTNDLR